MTTRPFAHLVAEAKATWSAETHAFHEKATAYFAAVSTEIGTANLRDPKVVDAIFADALKVAKAERKARR